MPSRESWPQHASVQSEASPLAQPTPPWQLRSCLGCTQEPTAELVQKGPGVQSQPGSGSVAPKGSVWDPTKEAAPNTPSHPPGLRAVMGVQGTASVICVYLTNRQGFWETPLQVCKSSLCL